MRRFIATLVMALTVVAMSMLSAVPAFADTTNNAGDNRAVCQFQDGQTALIDADVCVSTGGIIVNVLSS